nr:hypothetical protein [uncultured bacterium]
MPKGDGICRAQPESASDAPLNSGSSCGNQPTFSGRISADSHKSCPKVMGFAARNRKAHLMRSS